MSAKILSVLYFFKCNAALFISLLSLTISTYNWWYNFKHTKAKINLIYKEHKLIDIPGYPLSFNLIIENISHLDVSISRMFLKVGGKKYEFDCLPNHVMELTAPDESKIIYSNSLPISISGLGAVGGFFCVRTAEYPNFKMQSLYDNTVSIIVCTNRKLIKSFNIDLKR